MLAMVGAISQAQQQESLSPGVAIANTTRGMLFSTIGTMNKPRTMCKIVG
jgi:hypothetical protein